MDALMIYWQRNTRRLRCNQSPVSSKLRTFLAVCDVRGLCRGLLWFKLQSSGWMLSLYRETVGLRTTLRWNIRFGNYTNFIYCGFTQRRRMAQSDWHDRNNAFVNFVWVLKERKETQRERKWNTDTYGLVSGCHSRPCLLSIRCALTGRI